MKTCKIKIRTGENRGKLCGAELVLHPNPEIKEIFCKNRKCENYYVCQCGRRFGEH